EIPQIADKSGKCFSGLDYLRHLLSEGLQISKIGIHGGLEVRLMRNTQKVLEWANSAKDAWRLQPDFIRRQMVRILDYVDGAQYARLDVPVGTRLLADPQLAQVGLIPVRYDQKLSSGYLNRMDF